MNVDVTIQTTVEVPAVPSTLKVVSAGKSSKAIDIADLNDEQLTDIADQWKTKLLKHAASRRTPEKNTKSPEA